MKLVVIGDEKERQKFDPILKAGKRLFSEVVYAPVQDVSIEIFGSPRLFVRGERIRSIDFLLPFPSGNYIDIFHSIVHSFGQEAYMPYSHRAFMLFARNILSLSLLKEIGYTTADYHYSLSPHITKKADFPVEIFIGDKSMHVEHKKQLSHLLRFKHPEQSILVKEISESPVIECLVIGDQVVASLVHKKHLKKTKTRSDFADHIAQAVKYLGSEYASVQTQDNRIIALSLSPDFHLFEKTCKANVSGLLLEHIKTKIESSMSVADSIIDFVKRVLS